MTSKPQRTAWRRLRPNVLALCAGILVGAIYWAIHVETPAPPWIALIGLLGILLGESTVTALRNGSGLNLAGRHAAADAGDRRRPAGHGR
ncbi:DUF1427 family protein [Amycolatopsis japonica]|uniref:DUF1427 family protein n=1 Tax=Amycolatopsis japonica TaxID=208439 RepID=UPI003670ECFD